MQPKHGPLRNPSVDFMARVLARRSLVVFGGSTLLVSLFVISCFVFKRYPGPESTISKLQSIASRGSWGEITSIASPQALARGSVTLGKLPVFAEKLMGNGRILSLAEPKIVQASGESGPSPTRVHYELTATNGSRIEKLRVALVRCEDGEWRIDCGEFLLRLNSLVYPDRKSAYRQALNALRASGADSITTERVILDVSHIASFLQGRIPASEIYESSLY